MTKYYFSSPAAHECDGQIDTKHPCVIVAPSERWDSIACIEMSAELDSKMRALGFCELEPNLYQANVEMTPEEAMNRLNRVSEMIHNEELDRKIVEWLQ